jgi:hypothetical protein
MIVCRRYILIALTAAILPAAACNESVFLFNPAFLNTAGAGVYPLTPGQARFNLIRLVNRTRVPVQFVLTIETEELVGDPDEPGGQIAEVNTETVYLDTFPEGLNNEVGFLVECPIERVGLGENLDLPSSEPGVFIGTLGGDLIQGFGVPANVFPLDASAGNFECGDTVIFEAIEATGDVGNVLVQSFVLSDDTQPQEGFLQDTFVNARILLEQLRTVEEEE